MNKVPFGIIVISVIMFFVGLATDIFWLGKAFGDSFPRTMPVSDEVYNAFAAPDILLSLLLYLGALGLLKKRKFGFSITCVAMGMWIFDSLLVLGITKLARIGIVGPCLVFALFVPIYLWQKRDIFE